MKKQNLKKKIIPFPSSFHMSNEGKKNINLHPLPLNSKKKKKKNQGAP
jgi:hypothetical protein